jgi:HK97 family phage portal protein
MADLTLFGALRNAASHQKTLNPVPRRGGWWRIMEPFTGAWQRNKEEDYGTVATYPTLYACIMRIAKDIGKLPFLLKEEQPSGIWKKVENTAYSPVLRKPNHYQTAQQFRECWQVSKLTQGNAYQLKQRDERGVVTKLYPLDPFRVKPLVSETGAVYYELQTSNLSLIPEDGSPLVVPAREIIHDREICLFHPLIGIPPLAAANWAVIKNLRILRSAAEFFGNNAQPSGILTAPGQINNDTATRLSDFWNSNFTGQNAGKVAVVGDDLKFMPLAQNSVDSQVVEQLRYSDEQICQPFGIPPFKVGIGSLPAGLKADDINILYHSDALSDRIEAMENLLDEALGISRPLGVELELAPLWRMDEGKMAEVESKLVGGKIKRPDEARRRFDLEPTAGGDTLWGQHQDYPLGVLAERNDLAPVAPPTPDPEPEDEPEDVARFIALILEKELSDAEYS